jgi:hypothetical protein
MTKIAGSGSASGSISQRHGSADPDPHQNVMDPEHCIPDPGSKPKRGGGGGKLVVLPFCSNKFNKIENHLKQIVLNRHRKIRSCRQRICLNLSDLKRFLNFHVFIQETQSPSSIRSKSECVDRSCIITIVDAAACFF